jgi:hypothetical protein
MPNAPILQSRETRPTGRTDCTPGVRAGFAAAHGWGDVVF